MLIILLYTFYNRTKETFNMDVYYKGNVDDKIIAFACNVDWGNEYINHMLEIFNENDIKITFLLLEDGLKIIQNY